MRGQAHHADFGAGDQGQDALEHAQARAQDGDDGDFLASELFHLHGAAPAFDLGRAQGQVFAGLVGQQRADFAGQLAKALGAEVGAAHDAQLVADQRMADFMYGHDVLFESGKRAGAIGAQRRASQATSASSKYRSAPAFSSAFSLLSRNTTI